MPDPSPSETHQFVMRVLQLFSFDNTEQVWWRTDGEYAPVTFFAQCSDFFFWGTADCERIDHADLDLLEQAFADARAADPGDGEAWAGELFCARKRGIRPQGACYKHIPKALWPLFDACGPEREPSIDNPRKRPSEDGGS